MMKHSFHKMKNLDYWLPVIFAVALGTGLLLGFAINVMWIGVIIGLLLGTAVLFVFYWNRSKLKN